MTRRFAKRAAKWNRLAVQCGAKPLDPERVQAIYERHVERQRMADPYAGCVSVTKAAQALGTRRSILFEWLDGEGWLQRTFGCGRHATSHALSEGWVVQRGAGAGSWPQVTPTGVQEIARRLGLSTGADSAT
jgi:hypothetical protein